jgi:hypothetical protein
VIRQSKIGAAMDDEAVQFGERSFILQQINTLPCRELSLSVLCLYPNSAATEFGLGAALLEKRELVAHTH